MKEKPPIDPQSARYALSKSQIKRIAATNPKKLEEERLALRHKLDIAVEALEFYANKDNWGGYHADVDTIMCDTEPATAPDGFKINLGGAKARAALAKIRGEIK